MMDDLLTMIPQLEQGETLFCPVSHAYLKPLGNGEVERTQYLMEGEWAKPRIIRIDDLREMGIRVYAEAQKRHAEYLKLKDGLKGYDIVLSFGKHRGKHLSEVSQDYLEWIARQEWKNGIPATVQNYLGLLEQIEFLYALDDPDDFSYDWEVEKS